MRDRAHAFRNRSRDLVCDQAEKKGYLAVSSFFAGRVCDGDAFITSDEIHCRRYISFSLYGVKRISCLWQLYALLV